MNVYEKVFHNKAKRIKKNKNWSAKELEHLMIMTKNTCTFKSISQQQIPLNVTHCAFNVSKWVKKKVNCGHDRNIRVRFLRHLSTTLTFLFN